MNLSKDAIKLLRWLGQNDDWMYYSEIEKKYKKFDHRSFSALKTTKLIEGCVFEDEIPECDAYGNMEYPLHYRISDTGKAYIEGRVTEFIPELREWLAIGISLVALVVSVISLIL